MRYGLTLPTSLDARTLAELAYEAEQIGWHGVFYWDVIFGNDPWVALAAVAMRTERIRIGTMLTPISRRRPWKLAGETVAKERAEGYSLSSLLSRLSSWPRSWTRAARLALYSLCRSATGEGSAFGRRPLLSETTNDLISLY